MKLNNIYIYTLLIGTVSVAMSSCVSSGDNPGIEFAPNMYISQAYEPYSQEKLFEINPNGMTMRLPVNGTIARGQLAYVYPHPNTGEGYTASETYTSNIPVTEANVKEGERLYNYACWHCHGKTGGNDGPIFKSGKMPGPSWPNVQSEYMQNLPMGKMYHTITYGKGLMGSHAHILSPEERWKVIYHIKAMSLGDAFAIEADNTEANNVAEEVAAVDTTAGESATETNEGH